jgi:hypothetical protein
MLRMIAEMRSKKGRGLAHSLISGILGVNDRFE